MPAMGSTTQSWRPSSTICQQRLVSDVDPRVFFGEKGHLFLCFSFEGGGTGNQRNTQRVVLFFFVRKPSVVVAAPACLGEKNKREPEETGFS